MGSVSNGGSCDGSLNKMHLENGYCNSSGFLLKYKKRKVSAVRDFPAGCGQNAPSIDVIPLESEAVVSVGDKGNLIDDERTLNVVNCDCVNESEIVNGTLSHILLKCPVKSEILDSLDDLMGTDMANAGKGIGVEFSPILEPIGSGLLKASENNTSELPQNKAPELSKQFHEVEVKALVKSDGITGYRTVSEVPSETERTVLAGGATTWSPPQCPTNDANSLNEIALKNKYPRRRVSATRDFPPFCGRNASSPSEEERLCVVLGKKPLSVVPGGQFKEMVKDDGEEGLVRIGESDAIVQIGHAIKREVEGSIPTTEMVHQKAAVQGGPLIEMVRADEEDSPPREKVSAGVDELNQDLLDRYVQEGKLEVSVPRPKTKSKKVIKMEEEDVNCISRSVEKDIVVYSCGKNLESRSPCDIVDLGNEVDRVVVQGLMAAANCPWRRGKGTVNPSLDGVMNRSVVRKTDAISVTGGEKLTRKSARKRVFPAGKALCENTGAIVLKSEEDIAIGGQDDAIGEQDETPVDPSLDGVMDRIVVRNVDANCVTGGEKLARKSARKKMLPTGKALCENKGALVLKSKEDIAVGKQDETPVSTSRGEFEVALPPFGPNSSKSLGNSRERVRETLRLFQAICRKLLQGEESKVRQQGYMSRRIDLQAAQIIRDKGKEVNSGKEMIGSVPGVEVGDEFQYRVELALVGIHRLYQAGIDYVKHKGTIIATSIVASGGYPDDLDNPDVLIYSGQGGNAIGRDKQPEDQKLERGNLALKNSISAKNPVRVIRGSKETKASSSDARAKIVLTYTYDGLYTVDRYWHDIGSHGKLVFKFELKRIPGQPEVAWRVVKKSKKFKIREGLCVEDISGGKELFPICAVNTIDNEKPPKFDYITEMKYPDWYCSGPPEGCDCVSGCSDSQKCSCVVNNGGEIPYNYNGAIVEAKPLVYECGPACRCPPSCHNRVSQHGIKFQLEIFKTESRGWGVRSLTSIPSGSFICEYIGELLEDREAEQRENDEYLFDIGQNYSDCSLNGGLSALKPDAHLGSSDDVEDGGFTIDAAQYGNVGRFINHSCSPNLYAQNVLYDHEDKRMPHIMLFAAENIPPLQELTYHYNYKVDQVQDSNGNIRMKNCYCGSAECIGRMY